jgi:hypothetical protein
MIRDGWWCGQLVERSAGEAVSESPVSEKAVSESLVRAHLLMSSGRVDRMAPIMLGNGLDDATASANCFLADRTFAGRTTS